MGMFKSAAKTGIAMKVLGVVRREASKPHNQAKARQLIDRVVGRGNSAKSGRRAQRTRRTPTS